MQIQLSFPQVANLAGLARAFILGALAVAAYPAFPRPALAQDLPPGTTPPARITYISPVYPERAMLLEASGDVTLQFTVDVTGQPRGIQVVDATAPRLFARTALAAAKHWRYAPPVVAGKLVAMPVRVVVRFAYL